MGCANEQGMCRGVGVREQSRKTARKSEKEREISEESAAAHLMNRSSTLMLIKNNLLHCDDQGMEVSFSGVCCVITSKPGPHTAACDGGT